MQSTTTLQATIAETQALIREDEQRLAHLQVQKAMVDLTKPEAAELKAVRARVRDRRDEVADLTVALELAQAFEKSAAGKARLEEIGATVRRVEAVGLALKQAGAIEDQAASVYAEAVRKRRALQSAMLDQAQQVVTMVRPGGPDDRFGEILAHLRTSAEGGTTMAQAWRLMQLAQGPEFRGLVTFGPGLT